MCGSMVELCAARLRKCNRGASPVDWRLLSVALHPWRCLAGMKDFFEQNCILFKGVSTGDEQRLEFMPL